MKNTDAALIYRTLNGDDNAFAELVKKYQKQVHALVWRKIGDFHTAEEITQDVFLKAYQRLATLKKPQSFVSWLYVIAANDCSTWLRKKRLKTQPIEDTSSALVEKATYSGYVITENERIAAEAQRDAVKKLLAKLQESDRTIITLFYFAEMTCKEISEFLGVSANTIKSRLSRARQSLKKEEPMIREALDNFQITPHLTENIMREIARIKPIAPSGSKPFVPWAIAASTIAVVFLMLGVGNQYFARFQRPYSFDATSEMTVDIIEAPFVLNLASKPNVRVQLGNTDASDKRNVSNQQSDDASALVADTQTEESVKNYQKWALPKAAKARLGKGSIRAIQFSPDGTQLSVSSNIGVWLYDVQTGKEISLFTGICGAVVFSPDGRFLAHGGGDFYSSLGTSRWANNVELWEIATGRRVQFSNAPPAAAALRFSEDGRTLISLGKSRVLISRLDVKTGRRTENKLGERQGRIHLETYALVPDKVAIGMDNGNIELWDTTTGKKLSTIRENVEKLPVPDELIGMMDDNNKVFVLAFSPDGTRLASGSRDTTVQLWETTPNHAPVTLRKHTGWPTALAFSPDGKLLASGGTDNTVILWDAVTGESLATFSDHLSDISALAFSPDGATLASGSSDGTIRFWNTEKRHPLPTHIAGHAGYLSKLIRKDESTLVSVADDGIITHWDLKTSQHTTLQTKNTVERTLFTDFITTFVFSPDGTQIAGPGLDPDLPNPTPWYDDILRLIDVRTGRELTTFPDVGGEMTFSPDGKILAYVRYRNKIHLLNIETGEILDISVSDPQYDPEDRRHPEASALIFSPDGEKLVSGTSGGKVQMWDAETGVELTSFFAEEPPIDDRYRDPIVTLAFSSDSSLLAVGSTKQIRLLGSPKLPHFKEVSYGENVWGTALVFSPDDSVIVRGLAAGRIQLWDVTTGDKLTTLDGHTATVKTLEFSADGKTFISAADDGTILLWDWDEVLKGSP
ncbi:MAG: sigma-70 family RNA polymerase sigma factor [Candidatus Poribacteria bacterium]|nr:sigma-70 family RNA polymerase sigma factor [Candidatus Poribacteria bacterium]